MVVVKTAVAIGHLVETKVQVVHQVVVLLTTQIVLHTATATTRVVQSVHHMVTAIHVRHLVVDAMTAHLVVTMSVNRALLATAKIVQHVQVLVVASATATVLSVLHTASQIHLASRTAVQSAVGQKIVVVIQVVIHHAKSAIQTVQTAQHAMIHANHHSAVHATQIQTRRLFSKTRFLSV
jgi:hypothetical protein